jgi:hypothetical protein
MKEKPDKPCSGINAASGFLLLATLTFPATYPLRFRIHLNHI